jgi:hypothetical protein
LRANAIAVERHLLTNNEALEGTAVSDIKALLRPVMWRFGPSVISQRSACTLASMTEPSEPQPEPSATTAHPQPTEPGQQATEPTSRGASLFRSSRTAVLLVAAAAMVIGALVFSAGVTLGLYLGGDREEHGVYGAEFYDHDQSENRGDMNTGDGSNQQAPEQPNEPERRPGS